MVSIIVPVYKAEKYIERCIESGLNQTYRNLEIIVVIDGSPDNSGEKCDAMAQMDSRIRVIHKENGGVSSARNVGLEFARGEYVFFCDADDALPNNAIEKMVSAMQDAEVQLVVGDITSVHIDERKNKVSTSRSIIRDYRCVDIKDSDALHTFWKSNNMLSSWGKLFQRKTIEEHQLRFCTDMIVMEDYAFVIDYISKCKHLCMIPESAYIYTSLAGVSLEEKRSKRDFFDDVLAASQRLEKFASTFSAEWAENYQQETIYFTLMTAYNMLWTIEFQGWRQRIEKYRRIKRAINNQIAQRMFAFYKAHFSKAEYFFIRRGNIGGILMVHGMRRLFKLV